jgi:hypothetical protein
MEMKKYLRKETLREIIINPKELYLIFEKKDVFFVGYIHSVDIIKKISYINIINAHGVRRTLKYKQGMVYSYSKKLIFCGHEAGPEGHCNNMNFRVGKEFGYYGKTYYDYENRICSCDIQKESQENSSGD